MVGNVPKIGVGVVVLRANEALFIKRNKPPSLGRWSVPGGHLEWGETLGNAALRELHEETGVKASLKGICAIIDGIAYEDKDTPQFHYTLIDFWAEWQAGEPIAASDVSDARWLARDIWPQFDIIPNVVQVTNHALAMRGGVQNILYI